MVLLPHGIREFFFGGAGRDGQDGAGRAWPRLISPSGYVKLFSALWSRSALSPGLRIINVVEMTVIVSHSLAQWMLLDQPWLRVHPVYGAFSHWPASSTAEAAVRSAARCHANYRRRGGPCARNIDRADGKRRGTL